MIRCLSCRPVFLARVLGCLFNRGAVKLSELMLDFAWNEVSLGRFRSFLLSQTPLVKNKHFKRAFIAQSMNPLVSFP